MSVVLCGHNSAVTCASKCRLLKGEPDDMLLGDTQDFIRKFEYGVIGTEHLHTMFADANTSRGGSAESRLTYSNQIK